MTPPARTTRHAPVVEVLPSEPLAVRVECPHCPRTHVHGASLGHRAAHCGTPYVSNGYVITDPANLLGTVTP